MVLPCEDQTLRRVTLDRPARRISRWDNLPRDIELNLTSLVEKEIDLARRTEILKRELQLRYDFSTYAAFRSIDRYNDGVLDSANIGQFLKSQGHYASEREILAIIRRIDTDGDARVTYGEFQDMVLCQDPSSASLIAEDRARNSYSEERRNRQLGASAYSSPTKSSLNRSSPARGGSATPGHRHVHFQTPDRVERSPVRNLGSSGLKDSRSSPSRRNLSPLRFDVENDFVRSLRDMVTLERELEQAKINLVQRQDFNIFDAFRVFDLDARGYISSSDLRAGLSDLGVYASAEEIDLYLNRYDKNRDRLLRFSEFSDSFTPTDTYYQTLLNRRTSNNPRYGYRRGECFMNSTQAEFRSIWRTHFKVETSAEHIRQRLYKTPSFNVLDAFNTCDLNEDGRVSKVELQQLIESHGFYVSNKEVSDLVERYDKDRDGRISYSEVSSMKEETRGSFNDE